MVEELTFFWVIVSIGNFSRILNCFKMQKRTKVFSWNRWIMIVYWNGWLELKIRLLSPLFRGYSGNFKLWFLGGVPSFNRTVSLSMCYLLCWIIVLQVSIMFVTLEKIAQTDPKYADVFLLENYAAFQNRYLLFLLLL